MANFSRIGNDVVANPTLTGSESDLTGLKVDGVAYKIPESDSGSGGYILELGAQSLIVETSGSITQEEYESLVSNYPNCQVTLQYGNTIYTFVANVLSTDNTILYFENPQADRTLIFTSLAGSYKWEVWESLIATTNTTQTIDGNKTFTGTVDFTNANVKGLSSGGLTETEVQALINTAITGALEGNY